MLNRRRLTLLAFALTLLLAPGLSLAGSQTTHSPVIVQSPVERLLTWAESAWSALTGQAPAAGRQIHRKAGCGIDPNGCPTGGGITGGGGTGNAATNSGGH